MLKTSLLWRSFLQWAANTNEFPHFLSAPVSSFKGREVWFQVKTSMSRNLTTSCQYHDDSDEQWSRGPRRSFSHAHPCPPQLPFYYFPINHEQPDQPCNWCWEQRPSLYTHSHKWFTFMSFLMNLPVRTRIWSCFILVECRGCSGVTTLTVNMFLFCLLCDVELQILLFLTGLFKTWPGEGFLLLGEIFFKTTINFVPKSIKLVVLCLCSSTSVFLPHY